MCNENVYNEIDNLEINPVHFIKKKKKNWKNSIVKQF